MILLSTQNRHTHAHTGNSEKSKHFTLFIWISGYFHANLREKKRDKRNVSANRGDETINELESCDLNLINAAGI